MKNFVIGILAFTTIASLIASVLLYERYSSSRAIVRVGSGVITKKQYEDAVDYQTQGSILKKLVFSEIVTQAATKAGVLPSSQEVDARISDIQRRAPQALGDASQNPAKMADLRTNLKLDMALDSLRIQGVFVTDSEVAGFYAQHKRNFALPAQVQTTLIVADNAVDAATAASLFRQGMPLDVIARQKRLHIAGMNGFKPNFQALTPAVNQNISHQVYAMKPGEVKTIQLGHQYLVVKANKLLDAGIPPLSQIQPEVARAVKLQKAPAAAQELAKLYQGANVKFEVDKYSTYFADWQNMPVSNGNDKKTASVP